MASRKKSNIPDLAPQQVDPRAPLDGALLLARTQGVLVELEADLLARARASEAVREALRVRHKHEQAARRTADPLELWERHFITQVAASWVLSCLFVRTLEDRGLLGQNRIAGPGAADSQKLFFELAPSLTEREYLLTVFRELTRIPAARDLFDARHNPVWLLGPSAEMAKRLLALFRSPSVDAPGLRFGQSDTRFLGDLYQNLSSEARERYDLLQTPHFIEQFILDKTIARAIQRFGIDEMSLIDPACGSGHFLLGSFERLLDYRLRAEPGLDTREAARRALDSVYGADINAYAVSIARFRLTLAFLEKAGFSRLIDAPALPLHLAVADSLLHSQAQWQTDFTRNETQSSAAWKGDAFGLEDEAAARSVLTRRYAAVVGNPPFGDPPSRTIKDLYRSMYVSASGKYVLAAPFLECFFMLARDGGFVGLINSSTFANHKFGQPLIEQVLPRWHIEHVINTAGVYFPPPGFSVPTVIIIGVNEKPGDARTLLVQQAGLDPGEYEDPSDGVVWQSIERHYDEREHSDEWIEVQEIQASAVCTYPWRLSGGAGALFVEALEQRATGTLTSVTDAAGLGAVAMSNADKLFVQSAATFERHGLLGWTKPHLSGETYRDYMCHGDERVFWPYDESLQPRALDRSASRWLAPHRSVLELRATFGGGTYKSDGKLWYGWHQVTFSRIRVPQRVLLPEINTEANALLDFAATSASQSLICFVPDARLDSQSVAAIVAFLNSSSLAAWMRKRCAPVSTARGDISKEKGRAERFRVPANMAKRIPLPAAIAQPGLSLLLTGALSRLVNRLRELGIHREDAWHQFETSVATSATPELSLDAAIQEDERCRLRSVVLQEELDWTVYATVLELDIPLITFDALDECYAEPDERPFVATVDHYEPKIGGPSLNAAEVASVWRRRRSLAQSDEIIGDVERWMFKRTWQGQRGVFGRHRRTGAQRGLDRCEAAVLSLIESEMRARTDVVTAREVWKAVESSAGAHLVALVSSRKNSGEAALIRDFLDSASVPFAAGLRYSADGLAKWRRVREQAAGESFLRSDYCDDQTARLRGDFDAPRERFISYPGCAADDDNEPIYGWAGWNHLQQALALGRLYQSRKDDAWAKERLVPMLAGLLELLPWVKQWHEEPDPDYGGPPGDYFETFLDGEAHQLGVTRDEFRTWRPAEKGQARKAKPEAVATTDGEAPVRKARGRRKKDPSEVSEN